MRTGHPWKKQCLEREFWSPMAATSAHADALGMAPLESFAFVLTPGTLFKAGSRSGAGSSSMGSHKCTGPQPAASESQPGMLDSRSIANEVQQQCKWGPLKMMDEAELADLGLLALQGVESAIHQVSIGLLATDSLRPGCVHSLLQPLAASGRQWQWLEHRVSVLLATSEPPPDPCLQALAAAVQGLLQHKAKALQGLPGAIAERRRGDAAALARRAAPMRVPPLPASIHLTHSDAPLPATQPRLTLLEVVVHTEKLRANLDTLAAVCLLGKGQNDQTRSGDQAQMTEGGSSLSGPALLTWLHDRLQDADASTTPILQELFCAAMAPFLAHMRAWAFRTGRLPQLHPDWGACSDEPSELLALLQPQDSAFQVLPGPLPTFLRPLEDAYMQTGLQLRMLQRLQPSGADTVDRMTVSAAAEAAMVSELAAGQDSLVSGASSSFQAIGSEDKSTAAACAVSFDPTKLPQVVARQSQGVAERRVAMLSLLHERAEAERAHKAQLQVKVQQARHQQTELRELAEVERQAASSRLRLGKLSRLRQLQAAAQARRSAAATERAESRALEQELMEQNALRELERAKVETEQLLQQRQKEVREMAQQAFRASWQGARWSLATSRSSQHKAREEEESAEASRRASFASTPMTGLSPVGVPHLGLEPAEASHSTNSIAATLNPQPGQTTEAAVSQPLASGSPMSEPTQCASSPAHQQELAAAALSQPTATIPPIIEPLLAVHTQSRPAPPPDPHQIGGSEPTDAQKRPQHHGGVGHANGCVPPAEQLSRSVQTETGCTGGHRTCEGEAQGSNEADLTSLETKSQWLASQPQTGQSVPSGTFAKGSAQGGKEAGSPKSESGNEQMIDASCVAAGREAQEEVVGRLAQASGACVGPGPLSGPSRGAVHACQGSAPVAAVVDAYILDPFFAQHRCISRACVRLLLYELPALLSSLRSVYMAAAGDFFSTLAEGLTAQTLLAPSLTERAVQGLLDTSSRGSSIQGDPVATSLQGNLICHTEQGTSQAQPARWLASVATDAGAVGALDAVVLHVPIAWPLSAVVGGHEVQQYQAIFSRLLCLQRPLTLLHSLWRHLSRLQGGQSRLRGGDDGAAQRRLRQLHAAQQEGTHFVQALQASTQQGLLWAAWHHLQTRLQDEAGIADVMHLKRIHAAYLNDAVWACLLHQEQQPHKAAADGCLQAIIHLDITVRQARQLCGGRDHDMLARDSIWRPVSQAAQSVHLSIKEFVQASLQHPRSRQHFADCLDFSHFYTRLV
ncbi:hypothetical protein WJX74_010423 [Apatococcus lobatus]|uniref:Gamma tubulin complex component C-terminal domain-containing protein n=1 Tax=Apatococcus lobatus TaxID=904363 RepID=A0AAW1Q8K0_9CHLO